MVKFLLLIVCLAVAVSAQSPSSSPIAGLSDLEAAQFHNKYHKTGIYASSYIGGGYPAVYPGAYPGAFSMGYPGVGYGSYPYRPYLQPGYSGIGAYSGIGVYGG